MMVSGMCISVQAELDTLFGELKGMTVRSREVSAQAFSKARGFAAELFRLAGQHLLTLHASLHPADGSERQMLFEALDELDAGRDLLVLDRGYVGNTMVASLAQRGLGFCLRADTRGWRCVADFLRSGAREQVVPLAAPRAAETSIYEIRPTPTPVRLIHDAPQRQHPRADDQPARRPALSGRTVRGAQSPPLANRGASDQASSASVGAQRAHLSRLSAGLRGCWAQSSPGPACGNGPPWPVPSSQSGQSRAPNRPDANASGAGGTYTSRCFCRPPALPCQIRQG